MSTQAGTRLWRCGQDGGRLDLAQIHFPLFPCGNASHPPLRGTADQWVQDHREPRRANVRRRVHRWVGPLTARQHRCYSRTLGSRKSGGSHYPSSRVMRVSPLARLLSVNGICASRSSSSGMPPSLHAESPAQTVWLVMRESCRPRLDAVKASSHGAPNWPGVQPSSRKTPPIRSPQRRHGTVCTKLNSDGSGCLAASTCVVARIGGAEPGQCLSFSLRNAGLASDRRIRAVNGLTGGLASGTAVTKRATDLES